MKELYMIFDEAQRVTSSRNACSRKLKNFIEKAKGDKNRKDIFETIFLGCIDRVLPYTKTDPKVSRITSFFAESISTFSIKNLEMSLEYLLARSEATDKTVRLRSCQIIRNILSLKLENNNQCELSAELCEQLVKVLFPRLSDRYSNVRVQAIYALKSLQDASNENDSLTLEYLRLMNSDDTDEVRSAVVECIVIVPTTLPSLVARVKDIHKNVRLSCLKRLTENVDMRHLHVKMRGMIIRHGLQDRDQLVKNAAIELLFKWLSTHDYKVSNMLKYLGLLKNEEEVELAAFEILANIENRTDLSVDIKKSVMFQAIDWQNNEVDSISPSEFLWTQLRCAYAYQHTKNVKCANMLSDLVPDIIEVCRMLTSVPMSTLSSNANLLMSFRNLLKMSTFFDKSDLTGNRELATVCRKLILDVEVPNYLIEGLLYTWKIATENTGHTGRSRYYQLMSDSRKSPISSETTTATSTVDATNDDIEPTTTTAAVVAVAAMDTTGTTSDNQIMNDNNNDTPTDYDTPSNQFRSLQIISWCLQQVVGGNKPITMNTIDKSELQVYEDYIPFIFENLPCADPERRGLSIKCLGLLPLYSDKFCTHQEILLQAANTEEEDENTRCVALQSLIDMATVYGDKFKDDITLSNILFRLLHNGSGALQRVAVEGAVKLLFSGCLSDPRLFANLMKFFFLPELSSDQHLNNNSTNMDDTIATQRYQYLGNDDEDYSAEMGTQARLHQVLSVFFHYFLIETGKNRALTLIDSISDLVSDISMLIRSEAIDISALQNVSFYQQVCVLFIYSFIFCVPTQQFKGNLNVQGGLFSFTFFLVPQLLKIYKRDRPFGTWRFPFVHIY